MNPLDAIRLRDQREQSSWAAFSNALDSLGNLDTHLKDRYLTTGQGTFGLFGGQPQESEWQRAFGQKPDLADVHRSAKIRGLLSDQGTIDEKTQRPIRELEQQRQIGSTLKQEQQNLDTRRAGVRNSISQLYTALAQETDPEAKRAIQRQISTLEAEGNVIGQDMGNVVDLMDSHNVPDYFYRRQDRSGTTPNEPQTGDITDADMEAIDSFVNSVATDTNTHYNESQVRALLAQAGLGNLKPFAKHISSALEAKQKFFIGREADALEAKKAGQALAKGNTGLKEDNAEMAKKIQSAKNSIKNLDIFIAQPTFENWKVISDTFSKMPVAEKKSLAGIPGIGKFLEMFDDRDMSEESFIKNRETYRRQAEGHKSVAQAYLNTLSPQSKKSNNSVNARNM